MDVQRLEAMTASFVAEQRVPGVAVGVVRDGGLAWSYGHGFADREAGRRPDARTLYRVASITKTFTACSILQLRDAGRLRLDDPLVAHVPEAAAIANPFGPVEDITLRRLLTHTSGLQGEHPIDDPASEPFGSIADVVRDFGRMAVVIPPDTQTKYCNIGFQMLGAVVERVAARPFAAYVQEHLLQPLGLERTAFDPDPLDCAVGYYGRLYSDHLARATNLPSGLFEADGGLWSCVEDLARWCVFWLGDGDSGVLARTTRDEMLRPWIVADDGWNEAQGLGLYWRTHGEERYIGHAGGLHGFITRFALSPKDGVGAIALVNGMGNAEALAFDLLDHAVAAQRARPLPQPAPPAPVPDSHAPLLGRYLWEELGEVVTVDWRDGALTLLIDDERMTLQPTSDPLRFTMRGLRRRPAGDVAWFVLGAHGRAELVNVGGYPFVRQ
jgi:CubicO group peptidase (beta-lactamase class C family)